MSSITHNKVKAAVEVRTDLRMRRGVTGTGSDIGTGQGRTAMEGALTEVREMDGDRQGHDEASERTVPPIEDLFSVDVDRVDFMSAESFPASDPPPFQSEAAPPPAEGGQAANLAHQADMLRRLHHGPKPLLLPNVWDVASAGAVAASGFPVIATSSLAVAASLGFPDADTMPVEEAFAAVARVASSVDLPVTADLEAGYQLPPEELVARLLDAGAVGCNLEDTDHHGSDVLVPLERQAERLRAVQEAAKAAGVPVVENARIDIFLRESEPADALLPEAIRRGRAYLAAGADCLYPIGLTDPAVIEAFVRAVDGPVNVWLRPDGPSRETLAQLGVARISLASGLFRAAMQEITRVLDTLTADA